MLEGDTYWDSGTGRFATVIEAWPGCVTAREATHAEIKALFDAAMPARRFEVRGGGEIVSNLVADEAGATVAAMIKRGIHPGNIHIGLSR